MPHSHRIAPGEKVDLSKISTRGKEYHDDRDQADREFKRFRNELDDLQTRLYAEGRQKLLIVLQAMDAGGKDGVTRSVFKEVNPQGIRIESFKAPSAEELSHDYLWRIHQRVPAKGMIAVFNRSHYEDVLVVRVDELVPKKMWEARFEQINQFEKYLSDNGTRILKFFIHISREEQLERFQERLDDPEKHWKFSIDDIKKRQKWDKYMAAYEDVLSKCSTDYAPWHVIPGDHNWYRNWAVAQVITETLHEMNPQYPPLAEGLKGLKLE
ncbi:polyphosphate kinase 2 family protein [Planctomicrobium piriforme]|uniref:Polyphosphate:nucleotide phosphotransferase, PPK2 family n=1 Tax=Planctomicrobium piriforme TaxID=1576369 RepID=A0A1I3LVU3_9PLAN|nr:polyphosphate kinase 2 family protein [Planctomicrobium piriforme]SFI88891.1 polyphosphate:nucleotide phosphotransferase, PPK2 family [Planctomicrobium piriforme]